MIAIIAIIIGVFAFCIPINHPLIPAGTKVTWHYRSAIGHGTVKSIYKKGTNADNTEYSIQQHDHHPGEPDIVHHYGSALTLKK